MHVLSFGRSAAVQTLMVRLLTLIALLALAFVAAYWTWQCLAPSQELRAPALLVATQRSAPAGDLFGLPYVNARAAQTKPVTLRLLGIAAADAGQEGYAVMLVEPGVIVSVHEGQSLGPGLRLGKVGTDHVILDRGGVAETLAWPVKTPAPRATAARPYK